MIERACPECQTNNPMKNRFCGHCGAPLTREAIAPFAGSKLTVGRGEMPMAQLRQVGQAVAVSLLTIAAEAGLNWLRRRLEAEPANVDAPSGAALVPQSHPRPERGSYTAVYHEEVVELQPKRRGLIRRAVSRTIWWKPDA